jgi:hypothetical protein
LEAGRSPHEIAAITGHASLKEVQRYTATADRKRLARSAMQKMKTGTKSFEKSKVQFRGGSPGRTVPF